MEASLRLDSVASAGMGMSRSKMSAAIKGGLVLVNWKAASSGTTDVRFFLFFGALSHRQHHPRGIDQHYSLLVGTRDQSFNAFRYEGTEVVACCITTTI